MAHRAAVYDEYLESRMRTIMEGLVEALVLETPSDVHSFCINWLTEWEKADDSDEQEVVKLRAARDLHIRWRDDLQMKLELQLGGACSSSAPAPRSREGSKDSVALSDAAAEALEQAKIQRAKSKDRELLKQIIDSSDRLQVLFGHLSEDQKYAVIDAVFTKEAQAGEDVIVQGEEGDNFYIVKEGNLDACILRGDSQRKVLEYGPGDMFGELALMYNAQRAATVTATTDVKLWALERDSFKMMVTTAENTQKKLYESFLESVDILRDLTRYELATLSDMLESEVFDDGEAIINQGEEGNYFYIVEDGECKAYIGGEQGEIEVRHYRRPGEYFGEIALLVSAARRATVRGAGRGCSVLSVSRKDFDDVLGPIKDILTNNMDKYPQYADIMRHPEEQEKAKHLEYVEA
eukprot:TRINITY_DN6350_c0_g1_i1.p1 TRINITY_DN6350_c0_g1~~TRINITY_DN6350_c0_g1_i1.p1  ORF type:complete len:407 (-),score=113.70 TRINITY_DN6350_c0_g1_i1:111-1331(-)